MKLLRLLLNIAIGVGLFLFATFLTKKSPDTWWNAAIFVGIAIVGKSLSKVSSGSFFQSFFADIYRYAVLLAGYMLIFFLSWKVLPGIKFNSFWKGFLLFLFSAGILSVLAKFVLNGLKAIIDFSEWGENPTHNFLRIGAGFIALLCGLHWIGGVAQCGLAGGLSLLGLLLSVVPNEYFDAAVASSTEIESEDWPVYRDQITLSDGTQLTEDEHGSFMDSNSHEWKKGSDGTWYDDGFRL